jgi:hypothetical protein
MIDHLDKIWDPRRLDEADLQWFRRQVLGDLLTQAPRLAEFLHGWLQSEELRRREHWDKVQAAHAMAIPLDLDGWSNLDLAQALRQLVRLSFFPGAEAVHQLLDRNRVWITHAAAARLESAPPPH